MYCCTFVWSSYAHSSLPPSLPPSSFQLDPHRVGTPSRSPSKSPMHPHALASAQRRAEYLYLLEQVVILLLSQSSRYLVDPSIDVHDKQVLRKELAHELVS